MFFSSLEKLTPTLTIFSVVHLETSRVVFDVDLVEGGLCVLVNLKLKNIDILLINKYAVGASLRQVRLADNVFAQNAEYQVYNVLKIALYKFKAFVVGIRQGAKQCFHPLDDAFYVACAEVA